jgi:phosphoribosyl 1,2-cyclic phosphodiesterase
VAVRILPLGSSSSGNATLLEFGRTRLLVDAGLSSRELTRRVEAAGVPPGSLACILLTHEHHDHSRGAERFSMKHRVPVACVPESLEAMNLSPIHLASWCPIAAGRPFDVDGVRVDPFPVPHDAAAPLGFVLQGEGVRVGIALDLGHATTLVVERLRGCHVLIVESNHDDRMLEAGPYPWQLKQRIGGRMGHLSNAEAAALLARVADDDCRAVVLAHLSEKNNTQALARSAASSALAAAGRKRYEMRVADARRPSVPLVL